MKHLKHAQAHEFSMSLSADTLRGAKTNAGEGFSNGGKPPYGYDRQVIGPSGEVIGIFKKGQWKNDKSHHVRLIPNVAEKLIVQRIFDEYKNGLGFAKIAGGLNNDQITPPGGGAHQNVYKRDKSNSRAVWGKSIIRSILRNEVYIGTRLYNMRSYKPWRRTKMGSLFNSQADWVRALNAHEAIIDAELFAQVQGTFKTRQFATGKRNYHRYLLSGIVICANCGYKFNGWTKSGNGHVYPYYSCSGYHRGGKSICRSVNVSAEELESVAFGSIRDYFLSPDWKELARPKVRAIVESKFGDSSVSREQELHSELGKVNGQLQNIVDAIKTSGYSMVLQGELPKLENLRDRLKNELEEVEKRKKITTNIDQIVEVTLSQLSNMNLDWMEGATSERKQQLLSAFLHKITITHDDNQIAADCQIYSFPQTDGGLDGMMAGPDINPPKNRLPRSTVSSTPGLSNVSLKSIAGARS